ncbi:hypothetical protein AX14_008607 [Amanita brunnescens Koide BX004]|nr:hypothetical protein AX14_008607 [Amanita brunnescens Koide BX004]
MPHSLPDLPYDYKALEPCISEQTMRLHHDKHHRAYVDALNAAEAAYAKASTPRERIALQSAIKFNGHINHSLFWRNLAPPSSDRKGNGGVLKDGPLKQSIDECFGGLDKMKREFNKLVCEMHGVGWGWVGLNPTTKRLEVTTTRDQDPLLFHFPIIGIDLWEHSYYLQYQNVKEKYLENIWKCINFEEAERRYREGREGRM